MFLAKLKKSAFIKNVFIFLAILGPGIITGSVDNDAGGITTYSVAGAEYGYQLIWTLIPCFFVLYVVQEMNARMGLVTGKGLADLIRENAGIKLTFLVFSCLFVANILNTTTEFAGVAGAMETLGVSRYIGVPLVAVAIWFLVVKGTYKVAERVFLAFSVALLAYVVSALMGKPDWGAIGTAIVRPDMKMDFGTTATVVGVVGTTISPWMQFYMQSSIIDKGLQMKNYRYTLLDIAVGCVATVSVAFFIMVACASTLHVSGVTILEAKDAANALAPLAGDLAKYVFGFGLLVASVFAAVILPVAVAFYVCEAFGFEAGLDKKWKEAPAFYWLYTALIAIGAGIILIPGAPLIGISLWSQRLNGILLPVVLIMMMATINRKDVMGAYVNKPWQNVIGWATILTLAGLSAAMLVTSAF
jgi:Mn2+/Fe2+ NRAMP family transporter